MRPVVVLTLVSALPGYLGPQSPPPAEDPRIRAVAGAVSPARIEADIRKLVSFGTRHTLSDTLSPSRGIGAARRWIKSELDRISAACGGCLEVFYLAEVVVDSGPRSRVPRPTNVVSVVAIQRGTADSARYLVISGHFDSRVSDAMNAVDSAPGANDDASGTAAVLEAARVLTRHRFAASIAYAALAGEEQGLLGGRLLARTAIDRGWRIDGVLNNDIIGNIEGLDGAIDNTTVRVFSEGTPPNETEAQRAARRLAGGEVDGVSRQLARYVDRIADRYLLGFDVMLVYRLDRLGRGGDHRAFADLGFPAVRLSEAHEHYHRQHQDVRVENGIAYGDVLEGVSFDYAARVTALNAATLTWDPPTPAAGVAGYRVYWRRTDSATWDHSAFVGDVRTHTFGGLIIDNYFFGVASVGAEGNESVVVFPTPGSARN